MTGQYRNPNKSEVHALTDGSNDKGYFIITPRIVWAMCRNPYDYILWSIVKDIAGERRECYIGGTNLAKLAMMSKRQVILSRSYLLNVGLLQGEKQPAETAGHEVWHLWVPDIWAENMQWCVEHASIESRVAFKSRQRIEADLLKIQPKLIESPLPFSDITVSERGYPVTPGVTQYPQGLPSNPQGYPISPGVTPYPQGLLGALKEEQGEQVQQGEKGVHSQKSEKQDGSSPTEWECIWTNTLDRLSLELTTATMNTYLRDTRVVNEKCNGRLVVEVAHRAGNHDTIDKRFRPMIERAVRDVAGRTIEIEFVVRGK